MLKLFRQFSTRRALWKGADFFEKVPDNAPTLEENTAWLGGMKPRKETRSVDRLDTLPTQTYEVLDATELDDPATNPDMVLFRSKRSKKEIHRVICQPNYERGDDHHPYYTLSVPVKSYDVMTSPFSTLPARQRPKTDSLQAFSDLKVVKLRSGSGGSGDVSFMRDSGLPIGPPDGGDGGDGGDVYVMAVPGLTSLHQVKTKYVAKNGTKGMSGQLDGKKGENAIITVPVGTTIRWCPRPKEIRELQRGDHENKVFHIEGVGRTTVPTDIQLFRESYMIGEGWKFKEKSEDWHMERDFFTKLRDKVKNYDRESRLDELRNDTFPIDGIDFSEPTTEPVRILKGGKGGLGNMHFLTPEIRNPRFAKIGREGIEENFIFELKLLADLGLVGLPNAGKSTLLRAISKARPKVGHWKFTTLQPTIGTIQLRIDQPPFTVADIPGIVEGAKDNKGMGLSFLRHIERSGGIVFVVSLGNKDPVADLKVLEGELGEDRLEGKNKLIVATKADLPDTQEKFHILREYCEGKDWKVVPCSPKEGGNIEKVLFLMAECSGRDSETDN